MSRPTAISSSEYSFISADDLPEFRVLLAKIADETLAETSDEEKARLLALTFRLVAAQHRLGVIDDGMQQKIVEARAEFRRRYTNREDVVEFFEPDRFSSTLSIQDNILFGRVALEHANAQGRVNALVREVAAEVGMNAELVRLGLEYEVGNGGSRLSYSQRQRLAIARAIMKNPDILVFNEPTSGLDPATETRVLNAVLEWAKGPHGGLGAGARRSRAGVRSRIGLRRRPPRRAGGLRGSRAARRRTCRVCSPDVAHAAVQGATRGGSRQQRLCRRVAKAREPRLPCARRSRAWRRCSRHRRATIANRCRGSAPATRCCSRPANIGKVCPCTELSGAPGRPIVIAGPEHGAPATFIARPGRNTVSIVESRHVLIRNLALEGNNLPVDGVKAEGHSRWAHDITLENLVIHGHGNNQQTVGISTKCPAWNWVDPGRHDPRGGHGNVFWQLRRHRAVRCRVDRAQPDRRFDRLQPPDQAPARATGPAGHARRSKHHDHPPQRLREAERGSRRGRPSQRARGPLSPRRARGRGRLRDLRQLLLPEPARGAVPGRGQRRPLRQRLRQRLRRRRADTTAQRRPAPYRDRVQHGAGAWRGYRRDGEGGHACCCRRT